MKTSYNWLQSYITESLPSAEELADTVTHHLAEIEEMERVGDDTMLDINILPNRAGDLLSHQGIAREIASLLNLTFKLPEYVDPRVSSRGSSLASQFTSQPEDDNGSTAPLSITVDTPTCLRYAGRAVRNITVGDSPEWMKKYLETIGQRSINNIVDVTNIVMYDCGQPMHAFDADKVSGAITIRQAVNGETMTTLDGKEVTLDTTDAVIADDEGVLALAGVKGGKKAEVDNNTKNIIIEVANFDATSVRKTSRKHAILTDSSKRFENNLSPEHVDFAMTEISSLLHELNNDSEFEEIVDIYTQPQSDKTISFTASYIAHRLVANVTSDDVVDILDRWNMSYTVEGVISAQAEISKGAPQDSRLRGNDNGSSDVGDDTMFTLAVPYLRHDDLSEPCDMAEEIGRIIGYRNIEPVMPELSGEPKVDRKTSMELNARTYMLNEGYSEIITYTFANSGKKEVHHSAEDKNFLRKNLSDGLTDALERNGKNAPLFGKNSPKELQLFEIGTVWTPNEEMHIAWNEKKQITEMSLKKFCEEKDINISTYPEITHMYDDAEFSDWSPYPFTTRDIAVWVPVDVSAEKLEELYRELAGEWLMRIDQFDRYEKDDRVSYAYRLVFQSHDKTLADKEITPITDAIYKRLEDEGWEIR